MQLGYGRQQRAVGRRPYHAGGLPTHPVPGPSRGGQRRRINGENLGTQTKQVRSAAPAN
jgi:hypothetical protein